MKYLCFIVIFLLSSLSHSSDYLMPRVTLKHPLKVRDNNNTESEVRFLAFQGQALLKIDDTGTWWRVRADHGDEGFVYKRSVQPYEVTLNPLENQVFSNIKIYKIGNDVYIRAGGKCYILDLSLASTIPVEAKNKISIKEYLSIIGGIKKLTPEQISNCSG